MTKEELYEEILKSKELQDLIQVSEAELKKESFGVESSYKELEAIKAILVGQELHKSLDNVFESLKKILL